MVHDGCSAELIGDREEHEGMDPRTDAEVIASSVDAPAAFGELFNRHATTLFRYFVRRVGPDEADSLLGELFLSRSSGGRPSTPDERRRVPGSMASRAISWPGTGTEKLDGSTRPLGW